MSTTIDIDAVTRGIATAALWADGQPLPDAWAVQVDGEREHPTVDYDTYEQADAAAERIRSQGDASDVHPYAVYETGDGPELGDLQHLDLDAEGMDLLRGYAVAFLAVAPPLLVAAFLDAARENPAADVQGDPAGYLGHTLYLSAAGHGISFTDRNTEAVRFAPLDLVAEQTCANLEHAGFYANGDGETASVDMLAPYTTPEG